MLALGGTEDKLAVQAGKSFDGAVCAESCELGVAGIDSSQPFFCFVCGAFAGGSFRAASMEGELGVEGILFCAQDAQNGLRVGGGPAESLERLEAEGEPFQKRFYGGMTHVDTGDHGKAGAAFAVYRGPNTAYNRVRAGAPEKPMVELCEVVFFVEGAPKVRIDGAANSLDVEELFGGQQRLCVKAKVFKMVVPAGVFSKYPKLDGGLPRIPS